MMGGTKMRGKNQVAIYAAQNPRTLRSPSSLKYRTVRVTINTSAMIPSICFSTIGGLGRAGVDYQCWLGRHVERYWHRQLAGPEVMWRTALLVYWFYW